MKNYVEELLDYLELYQAYINQGLVNSAQEQKIEKFIKEVSILRSSLENGTDLYDYDFKALKRDVGSLFHADVFSHGQSLGNNPDELLGKTFGVLDEIGKCIKGQQNIKYNSTSSDTFDGNFKGKKKQADEKMDSNKNLFDTVTSFISNRIDYYLKGIPSSYEEFLDLLEKSKRTIDSLYQRLSVINETIEFLERDLTDLNIEFSNSMLPENIEYKYFNELKSLQSRRDMYEQRMRTVSQKRNEKYREFEPEIVRRFNVWKADARSYIMAYNELLDVYYVQQQALSTRDLSSLEAEIKKRKDFIIDNYSDEAKAFEGISHFVLEENEEYGRLFSEEQNWIRRFKKANSSFNNWKDNKEEKIRKIREEMTQEYNDKKDDIDFYLGLKRTKRQKIEDKLQIAKNRQRMLIEQYGSVYTQTEGKKR